MANRRSWAVSALVALTMAGWALATGAAPAAAADAASAGANLVPAQGVLFGAYVQGLPGQGSEPAEASLETTMHRKLDLLRIYRPWDEPQPAPAVVAAVRRGQIPLLSIRPGYKDGRIVSWASVARGDADTMIAKQADGLRSLSPSRLFLSFHHEPDDPAAATFGTPADFVAAWRHYRQVFAARGVSNVAFVWIMTPSSFSKAGMADAYYPGDDAVDWIGEDAYNWFGCREGKSTSWRSPAELIAPFASWAAGHGKPLMLAEWGSAEDPAQPQRKAQWLRDGLAAARTWPQLRAMSYFDGVGNCNWRLDTGAALQGFADDGDDPAAHGRASAFLLPSTRLGVAPLAVHFDGSGSTGTGAAASAGIGSWTLDFGDGSSPASGVGQPPADLVHSYPAGTFTARLRVTDGTGAVDQDERSITAAAAPTISGSVGGVTSTSATIHAWIAPQGFAATARAEWGSTTAYGQRSALAQIPATSGTTALTFPLAGLSPATHYYARVVATSAAGTRVRNWTFDTPGPPTVAGTAASELSGSSARLTGKVNPHLLTAGYYFEWGRSTDYGHRSDRVSVDPISWSVYASLRLSGLDRRQTYHFRLVAANAAGRTQSADQVFTTT